MFFFRLYLGVFVSLVIQNSFWAAIGIMQLGGMSVVAVAAFSMPSSQSKTSTPLASGDNPKQLHTEGQSTSKK